MKKHLTVALGLAVLATPAFATKARLQALGEDTYGSFYIDDNRNIWLNAANINNHKDLVTFEWGTTSVASDVDTASGATASPRAEGGIYKGHGNLVYGLHFGGASNTANQLRAATGLVDSFEDNNVDLFVGGDAGIKWGANVGYSKSADNEASADANQESLRTRLGVIAGDIEGYANINFKNKAEDTAGSEFEGKLGGQVGAIFALSDYRLFADYRMFKAEGDFTGTDEELNLSQLIVGAGRATKVNDKATLFTKAQVVWAKVENDIVKGSFAAGTCNTLECEEYSTLRVPVVIGLEYDALTWLQLRASVGQALWGKEEDKDDKRGLASTTVVNAGASLKFGELSVDGVIGNDNGTGSTPGSSTAAGNGTLRTDVLMTRVGMNYRF